MQVSVYNVHEIKNNESDGDTSMDKNLIANNNAEEKKKKIRGEKRKQQSCARRKRAHHIDNKYIQILIINRCKCA